MDDEVAQITYKIDKKSYKLIQESIKLETDKTEIAEGTEAEIDVEFVVNFDKYDSGLKIKIPSEAKKAYSEDSQNILGSLFGTPEEEELIVTPDPKETEQNIINFGESSVYPEETNQYFYPEETVTPTEVTQSLSFYDYYSNIFASIGLPNNYVFRDYTDITGQVYYGNGEYSIAYISSYPEDSYEACCDYEQSYLQSNQYATLVSTKEGVNIDGTKYMAFYELDNSSDNVDIVVVIGDNNNSVMITVSGYFVEEYGLDLEKVMEDLVNSVHFPTSLATNF